MPSIYMII